MNGRMQLAVAMALTVILSACSGKDKPKPPTQGEQMDEAKDRWSIDSARRDAEQAAAAAPRALEESTWQLVRLRGPADTVFTPKRGAVYTVVFAADGQASVTGDCNRGTGSWKATQPNGLAVGPLAGTMALCPPGSLSERFLDGFQSMRSYVIVDGKLYISTATGGIYEFAPETNEALVAPGDGTIEAIFLCTDSTGARSRVRTTFAAGTNGKATLVRGKTTVVLARVLSGSGARYQGGGVTFWNKGREAMLTWHGANLSCATTDE